MGLKLCRVAGCTDTAWSLAEPLLHTGTASPGEPEPGDLELECGPAGLALRARGSRGESLTLHLDFLRGRQGYRLAYAAHAREDLVRALGSLPRGSRIVDASAGLGRDGLVLAARGFQVTMLERNPVLVALLAEALDRASAHEPLKNALARLELRHEDARTWVETRHAHFDAAVFDPMFPSRGKDAAVKQEMRVLQSLLGAQADADAPATLAALRRHVRRRVVVKRPLHAPPLGGEPPAHSLRGRSTRFDVYLPA